MVVTILSEKKAVSPSLRKILVFMLALFFIVISLFAALIFYTYNSSKKETVERAEEYISRNIDKINGNLYNLGLYLWDTLINNSNVKSIRDTDDQRTNNNSARDLINSFEYQNKLYNREYSFLFYCPQRNIRVHNYDKNLEYKDNYALEKYVCDLIELGVYKGDYLHWQYYVSDNSIYILQVYRYKSSYMACWINADIAFADLCDFAERSSIIPVNSDGNAILERDQAALKNLTLENGEFLGGELGKDYFYSPLKNTNFSLVLVGSPYFDVKNLATVSFFIGIIVVIAFGFSFYTLYYYKHYIEKPMASLQNHIAEYIENPGIINKKGFSELNEAASVFESLTTQLKNLKIQYYEEKLSLAKTQLEFYQLQIKPHFFVNCFSIIFSMAQKKDFEKIQDFSIKLSNYVRYLFSDCMNKVTIRNELDHITDYLNIMRIRHRTNAVVENSADPGLLDYSIPPLVLLTFVENTLKFNTDIPDMLVTISVTEAPDDKIRICVDDNGHGFSERAMEICNVEHYSENRSDNTVHIGLHNIYRRLELTYPENFKLFVCNNKSGGASIELTIPKTEKR